MALNLLRSLDVYHGTSRRLLSLCTGDLSQLSVDDGVDYLGVSALPNDYSPSPSSLIGALYEQGISVQALSENKYADYRPEIPCWVSNDVPEANFQRIVVFEPNDPANTAYDLVTYLFSAVRAAQGASSQPVTVALPLVSTGYGKANELDMLDAIFFEAAHWCGREFPFAEIKITVYKTATSIDDLTARFDALVAQYNNIDNIDFPDYAFYSAQATARINQVTLPDYLTYRQAFGICMYTTNFYSTINRILRENDRTSDDFKKLRPLVEAIDTGLRNIPSFTDIAYRGESSMSDDRIAENSVGSTVTNLAYTSTQYIPDEEWFLNAPYRFTFQSLTGSVVEDYSFYPGEHEVLFVRLMKYLVIAVDQTDYYLFTCEEVEQRFRG